MINKKKNHKCDIALNNERYIQCDDKKRNKI
jgi:hypothetical protein